ncbi:MAG: hypothetical protein KF774_01465 [Planctomyces sp.]|nr:hypothetical protein [Planctomyces sp.]
MHPEKISLVCFFASYVLALVLELTRLLRSMSLNRWAGWLAAAAGFVAQTTYLIVRSRAAELPPLLSSTHDWLLVLAWLTVLVHLLVALVHRQIAVGVFTLPIVVLLVGASRFVSSEPNPIEEAHRWWSMAHATFLVLGIAGVIFGAALSVMYLVQHARLKRPQSEVGGLRMFSLERIARLNWWSVIVSVPLLTLGMATGALLTWLSRTSPQPISLWRWSFFVSGAAWLVLVALFGWLLTTRRATGRLVAWRTLLAGAFVLATLLTLGILSGGMHGAAKPADDVRLPAEPAPFVRTVAVLHP